MLVSLKQIKKTLEWLSACAPQNTNWYDFVCELIRKQGNKVIDTEIQTCIE